MADSLHFTKVATESLSNTVKKTPIVFLHGWGLNSAIWQPLLDEITPLLAEDFDFITVDLPGFGQNNHIDLNAYSLDNICQLISETIAQPAIYLGWSLGGLVATKMALDFNQQVLGLISVASTPLFVEQQDSLTDEIIWPGIKPAILSSFHHQLSQDSAKTIKGFLKIQAMGSPHIRQDLKQITELVMAQPLPSKSTLDKSLSLLETSDFRAKLAQIQQPFLRLYGRNDSLVPKTVCPKINDLIPKSEHHVFEGASHAPFISHLPEFSHILANWLIKEFNNKI